MKIIRILTLLTTLIALSLVLTVPVFAQGTEPPPVPAPASVGLLDIAFFVATVAFFKSRFGLVDKNAFFAAVGVGALFALAPQLMTLVPAASPWVDLILNFIKFVVIGTGSYNFLTDVGPKFLGIKK